VRWACIDLPYFTSLIPCKALRCLNTNNPHPSPLHNICNLGSSYICCTDRFPYRYLISGCQNVVFSTSYTTNRDCTYDRDRALFYHLLENRNRRQNESYRIRAGDSRGNLDTRYFRHYHIREGGHCPLPFWKRDHRQPQYLDSVSTIFHRLFDVLHDLNSNSNSPVATCATYYLSSNTTAYICRPSAASVQFYPCTASCLASRYSYSVCRIHVQLG
jgi:hypothetical protein